VRQRNISELSSSIVRVLKIWLGWTHIFIGWVRIKKANKQTKKPTPKHIENQKNASKKKRKKANKSNKKPPKLQLLRVC
jgi:hypothetical protein